MAKSSAISMPAAFAAATIASKSAHVPSSGLIASCPPSSEPIAHGEPTSPGAGRQRVVRAPCGSCARSDAPAGGRRRRSRAARAAAAPPRRRGSRPTSAGRARTRSRSARARGRRRPRAAPTSTSPWRSPASAARPSSTVTASRPRSTAPSESSPARSSWPASTLRRISSCQVAMRSVHAATANSQRPGRSTRERRRPSDRCRTARSGTSRQSRLAGRLARAPHRASVSCPSLKTVA